MNIKKPPLGLLPRRIHDNLRLNDIMRAVDRYVFAAKVIPLEWVEEYNELVMKEGIVLR